MKYHDIIDKVSQELGIPFEVVNVAYKSYWKFIKQTIQSLPLKDNLSEEEFSTLKTNFNVPSLGKLACTLDKYNRVKKRFKLIKNFRNAENK